MKKEIITAVVSGATALIMALLFDILGGYSITVIWMWEAFALLLSNMLAIKRIIYSDTSVMKGIAIDIGILVAVMVGYLINFHTIEVFPYEEWYIILSRTLIIINYYLICVLVGCYKKTIANMISVIFAEWISVFVIVFYGGTRFERIIDSSDNYVEAISGRFFMNVVSYYCMPGKKLFWIVSTILVVVLIFLLCKIYKKIQRIY